MERILYTPGCCNHCAKRGEEPETACEPKRCVKCMEVKSDEMCGTRVSGCLDRNLGLGHCPGEMSLGYLGVR